MSHQVDNSESATLRTASDRAAQRDELKLAYALVRDLMQPRRSSYWFELFASGSAAWLAFAVAVCLPLESAVTWVALLAASLLFFRVSIFIHELTHRQRAELPGFFPAWNISVGAILLLPSIMYEGIHKHHHGRSTYGTAKDPEYLPFAARPGGAFILLALNFLGPLHLALRFLLFAPLSWLLPPFRAWVTSATSTFGFNPYYRRAFTAVERRRLWRAEALLLSVWYPALAATLVGWLPWHWLLLWYLMCVVIASINHLRELVAHRYESTGQPMDCPGQLRDSVNTPGAWWTALWAPLGLRFHALHHLFPKLPYHNLALAHGRLTSSLPASALYHQSCNSGLVQGLVRLFWRAAPR